MGGWGGDERVRFGAELAEKLAGTGSVEKLIVRVVRRVT